MKKNIFYLILALVILVTSCELPNNIDPKGATVVPAGSQFLQGHISLVNQVGSINVNTNISRLLTQYQSEVTYLTESRYNFSDRQIPDTYSSNIYNGVLMNLKDCKLNIEAKAVGGVAATNQKKNQLAILEILSVYGYQLLLDNFGNVPYTESLLGADNSRPVYDDALTIYKDLVTRLDNVLSSIEVGNSGFGADDILYSDDMLLWKKFAASLKLRIGMRLADVTEANPATIVSQAIASGVFTSQAESAIQFYIGISPYVNSYYSEFVLSARSDYCPTNTLVNMMTTLNDPRRAIWFTQYPAGVYTGLPYGLKAASNYNSFSHFADLIRITPAYPVNLCDYVEVEFLLAEAAERGFAGTPADAEGHYNNAILASMSYWGVSDADAAAYLAQPAVAYTTAAGTYKQKIGTQKWLGLFDRGDESWSEWRRLDFPIFNPPEGMTYADIPMRMPYPYNENKMNKVNYDAAAAAIGGDQATTKLFWDKF
ncbi:MAG: SusD/RagB family nutrient-binding outer membrane lipoprotein [Bacteroidales bacterium]